MSRAATLAILGAAAVGLMSSPLRGKEATGGGAAAAQPETSAKASKTPPKPRVKKGVTAAVKTATPTMPVNDVRIGMKGYGLTVFHGTKIEPFPVEVVSVVPNFSPGHSTIWIKCPTPRLTKTGPIEGMSGSPIYLWASDGEKHELGKGGKLIGAFAFGYPLVKECLVGVQPIGYMRKIARRADAQKDAGEADQPTRRGRFSDHAMPVKPTAAGQTATGLRMLARMQGLATSRQIAPADRMHLDAITKLMRGVARAHGVSLTPAPHNRGDHHSGRGVDLTGGTWHINAPDDTAGLPPTPPAPFGRDDTGVRPLLLPMAVGSSDTAQLVAPLLNPLGIMPIAGGGGVRGGLGGHSDNAHTAADTSDAANARAHKSSIGGKPPPSIHAAGVKLAPGSVLSIPLAFGDLDLSAVGTVTDVLPDGTVLAFGHQMFGQGHTALPMATGYVHFVVPRLTTSFKQGASLRVRGSIVEDQTTGVAGIGEKTFQTAPVAINVHMPGQPLAQYHYRLVNHPKLTPTLGGILTLQSITAAQQLPIRNTVHLKGKLVFTGDRTIKLDTILPGAQQFDIVGEIMPIITVMMTNPHQSLKLDSIHLDARVQPTLEVGSLVNARLNKSVVAPGESVHVTMRVQPYARSARTYHTTLKIPADLAEGDYPLAIVDASTYAAMTLADRPHLMQTTSVDDLQKLLQKILSIKQEALYVMLRLPHKGIAVGRTELPALPSSMRAQIATPSSTLATPYIDTTQATVPTKTVVQGHQMFTLNVRRKKQWSQPKPLPSPQGAAE